MMFRMAEDILQLNVIVDISLKENKPMNCVFVTQDQELQKYMELNSDFETVINEDKITDKFCCEFDPDEKYMEEWEAFIMKQ